LASFGPQSSGKNKGLKKLKGRLIKGYFS
jgi:hypothetical protein